MDTEKDGLPGETIFNPIVLPPLEFDHQDYMADLHEMDLGEEQKIELLHVLWDMMRSFVELGADIKAIDPCGQIFDSEKLANPPSLPGVKSSFTTAIGTTDVAPGKDCE